MSKHTDHRRFSSQPGLDEADPPDAKGTQETLVPFATTLLVRDTCLCLHVQRAARALARRFDDALRPVGLTNSQFSLLMALNRPAPPPMGPVAALLAMDRTTLTAALKRLEARGLVQILRDPADRRSRLLALTVAGRSLLARAVPIWQESHALLDTALAGGQAIRLRQDLAALC
ncbi:MarR family winged helix-turn-helix transcriptional regulator [Labrys neptuniae]|uniref:MarR family winged helix-turn-helix transcriptional regulator n=1 Tax=Labrys neptuniae TaxID=376174 RepID=UPI002890FA9A|nr:MarR family winged helix-turn-helix transcriptional regulator [Labrys neptuniae]MDT3381996.1 MarR family winged helix-turn-helix transcriptional regulator [Labrys neptuniae]